MRGPATIDAVGPVRDLESYWQSQEAARRRATPWLAEATDTGAPESQSVETHRLATT